MKKITFILAFILCGLVGVQASRTLNFSLPAANFESTYFSVADNNENGPKFTITGKVLTVKNLEIGSQVDIYSVLGAKVYTFTYTGNPVTLNLSKGLYIIKVDKNTQKIML